MALFENFLLGRPVSHEIQNVIHRKPSASNNRLAGHHVRIESNSLKQLLVTNGLGKAGGKVMRLRKSGYSLYLSKLQRRFYNEAR